MPLATKAKIEKTLQRSLDPASYKYDEWFELSDSVRGRYAKLLNTSPDNIALSTSVAELVSHVANGIDIKPTDEVLLLENDYPSMVLPWLLRSEQIGFKVRFASVKDFMNPSSLKISPNTRVVACSHVLFNSGIRLPIAEIGAVKSDALFISDVSQSFGGLSIGKDILSHVDILVGVAYKWLLCPYGSAFGYFSSRALEKIKRTHASWLVSPTSRTTESLLEYTTETLPGARKFDRGQSPAILVNVGIEASLDLLIDQGLGQIEKHNLALADMFIEALPKSYQVLSPRDFRSAIVCIRPQGDVIELKNRLSAKNIDVSVREGALRASFHLFNSRSDVEALLRF